MVFQDRRPGIPLYHESGSPCIVQNMSILEYAVNLLEAVEVLRKSQKKTLEVNIKLTLKYVFMNLRR